jgi:copper/silver efflux system protein
VLLSFIPMYYLGVTANIMSLGGIAITIGALTGTDVMKRIAAPMIGGIITSAILELLVYPAIYTLWKWRGGR